MKTLKRRYHHNTEGKRGHKTVPDNFSNEKWRKKPKKLSTTIEWSIVKKDLRLRVHNLQTNFNQTIAASINFNHRFLMKLFPEITMLNKHIFY